MSQSTNDASGTGARSVHGEAAWDRRGVRAILALAGSVTAVAIGLRTVQVQADNFALAAKLDRLQRSAEWNERCATELRAGCEQFEFDAEARENRRRIESTEDLNER